MEHDFFQNVVDNLITVVLITDEDHNFVYANEAFLKKFNNIDIHDESRHFREIHEKNIGKSIVEKLFLDALKHGYSEKVIIDTRDKDGNPVKYLARTKHIPEKKYVMWTGIEVRELQELEEENNKTLEKLNEMLVDANNHKTMMSIALKGSRGFSWECDVDKRYLELGNTFEAITGYPPSIFENSLDKIFSILGEDGIKNNTNAYTRYKNRLVDVFTCEVSFKNSNGEVRWFLNRGNFIDDEKQIMTGVTFDITENKKYEQELHEMAYRDALTGVFNIHYLSNDECIRKTQNSDTFALLVTDVVGFSKINELFGHDFGNLVLIGLVDLLKEKFNNSLVVRVSADKFLVCLKNVTEQEAYLMAKEYCKLFSEPFIIENQNVNINMKIGLAYVSGPFNIVDLFKDAEIALYYAKRSNRQSIYVSNEKLRKELNNKIQLEFELHNALRNNEFLLYFQPNVSAETRKIIGAEALIRWMHPEMGMISPDKFIPLAEETGLIIPIGDYVIAEAARNLKNWRDMGHDIYISLNVSAKQFTVTNFVEKLRYWIEYYDLPTSSIIIEITESLLITDFDRVTSLLNSSRNAGIKVALDDFGTGYSSLYYLGKMPIDNLKIDKAFLDNVLSSSIDKAILEAIISLAHKLGFYVTAEGVEKDEQVELLQECGCDVLQGYLFSKPLPAEQFGEFIMQYSPEMVACK